MIATCLPAATMRPILRVTSGADCRKTPSRPVADCCAGEVAQLVEHTAENRGVAGSSPALATSLRPDLGLNGDDTSVMRAVVHDRYGPPEVLRLEDVERPVPKDDEVLIRIRASTVNRTDCHIRQSRPVLLALLQWSATTEAEDPRLRAGRRGRGGWRSSHAYSQSATTSSASAAGSEHRRNTSASGERKTRRTMPAGMPLRRGRPGVRRRAERTGDP